GTSCQRSMKAPHALCATCSKSPHRRSSPAQSSSPQELAPKFSPRSPSIFAALACDALEPPTLYPLLPSTALRPFALNRPLPPGALRPDRPKIGRSAANYQPPTVGGSLTTCSEVGKEALP